MGVAKVCQRNEMTFKSSSGDRVVPATENKELIEYESNATFYKYSLRLVVSIAFVGILSLLGTARS